MRIRDHQEVLRGLIGTLSHNRTFTTRDVREYCIWGGIRERVELGVYAASIVQWLRKKELIQVVEVERGEIDDRNLRGKRPSYYPTAKGWEWIEKGEKESEHQETSKV